jgi:phosphoglycolate phosphatase-like HAD superfamily hydrolase
VPFALAASGQRETAEYTIRPSSRLPAGVPVVTCDDVAHAKPDPDLFRAAADRLGVPQHACFVGDSVWDLLAAQRARALGVGLVSGGYDGVSSTAPGLPRL